MRLIDADKLVFAIQHELWDWESVDGITATTVLKQTISDIANEPTVKAIPIKWLKNKSKDLADAYWNNVRNKLVLDMKDLPLVMDLIVEEWEKENGRSK